MKNSSSGKNSSKDAQHPSLSPSSNPNPNIATEALAVEDDAAVETESSSSKNDGNNNSKYANPIAASFSNPNPNPNIPNPNISTIMSVETLALKEDTLVEMESSISQGNGNNNSKDAKPFSVSSCSNPNPLTATITSVETLTLDEKATSQTLKNIDKLGPDLIQEILSRLPFDSLLLCKQVCPSWCSMFQQSDHPLPKLHYTRSIQNPNDNPTSLIIFNDSRSRIGTAKFPKLHYIHNIDRCDEAIEVQTPFRSFFKGLGIVGSCNGFLCLTDVVDVNQLDPSMILCNPVIGDWIKLPDFPGKFHAIHFGFGYNPKTKEYKVVRMHRSSGPLKVNILTLGSNTWRNIGTTTSGIIWDDVFGVHLNGVLHWLKFDGTLHAEGIKTFNLDDETFGVVSLPDSITGKRFSYGCDHFNLGVLGGRLMLVDHTQEHLQQVWLMKDFKNKSWILEFTIPKPSFSTGRPEIRPLKMLKNGNILLECGERLYTYDPIAQTHELLEVPGLPSYFTAYPHMGTLVTVEDVIAIKGSSSMTGEQQHMSANDGDDKVSSVDTEEDDKEEQLDRSAAAGDDDDRESSVDEEDAVSFAAAYADGNNGDSLLLLLDMIAAAAGYGDDNDGAKLRLLDTQNRHAV